MENSSQTEIQLSKSKLTLMLFGSIIFVAIGIYFIINPAKFLSVMVRSTTIIFIAGLAAVLFFGLVGLFIFKKLGDKKAGLIISDDGITDNSSGVSAGFIPWSDIIEIKETRIYNQKLINLVVKNPEQYISRQKSTLKRKTMQINYKSFGTAIGISANGLKWNYADLKDLIEKKYKEYKLTN